MSRVPGTYSRPRILYVLPAIPDDASAETKNGLAIRNACATEGRCPCCRTVGELRPDLEIEGLMHLVFDHEDWCSVLRDGDAAA
jgi:hypothetical protein